MFIGGLQLCCSWWCFIKIYPFLKMILEHHISFNIVKLLENYIIFLSISLSCTTKFFSLSIIGFNWIKVSALKKKKKEKRKGKRWIQFPVIPIHAIISQENAQTSGCTATALNERFSGRRHSPPMVPKPTKIELPWGTTATKPSNIYQPAGNRPTYTCLSSWSVYPRMFSLFSLT